VSAAGRNEALPEGFGQPSEPHRRPSSHRETSRLRGRPSTPAGESAPGLDRLQAAGRPTRRRLPGGGPERQTTGPLRPPRIAIGRQGTRQTRGPEQTPVPRVYAPWTLSCQRLPLPPHTPQLTCVLQAIVPTLSQTRQPLPPQLTQTALPVPLQTGQITFPLPAHRGQTSLIAHHYTSARKHAQDAPRRPSRASLWTRTARARRCHTTFTAALCQPPIRLHVPPASGPGPGMGTDSERPRATRGRQIAQRPAVGTPPRPRVCAAST